MEKQKFNKNYIQCGFTSISDDGEEKGQYVLCYKVLDHYWFRPSKLKVNLEKAHPNYNDKVVNFFKRKEVSVKRQRLDSTGEFPQHSRSII